MTAKVVGRHLMQHSGPNVDRNKLDLYPTPREATLALLDMKRFRGSVWECASGMGHISKILVERGIKVISTDVAAKRYKFGRAADFLRQMKLLGDNIVTNPPYDLLTEFIQHGLSLRPHKLVLHIPMQSLLKVGRRNIFEQHGYPARIHVFVPCLKVDAKLDGHPTPSIFNHTWTVWEPRGKKPTQSVLRFINWRDYV